MATADRGFVVRTSQTERSKQERTKPTTRLPNRRAAKRPRRRAASRVPTRDGEGDAKVQQPRDLKDTQGTRTALRLPDWIPSY
jgi:hypothetical protein